ncbi:hypothetical protein YB2330_005654 [Saitoella coloradoensis]
MRRTIRLSQFSNRLRAAIGSQCRTVRLYHATPVLESDEPVLEGRKLGPRNPLEDLAKPTQPVAEPDFIPPPTPVQKVPKNHCPGCGVKYSPENPRKMSNIIPDEIKPAINPKRQLEQDIFDAALADYETTEMSKKWPLIKKPVPPGWEEVFGTRIPKEEKATTPKETICLRCHNLKHHSSAPAAPPTVVTKNKRWTEPVAELNTPKFTEWHDVIRTIRNTHPSPIVLHIMDIADFPLSLLKDLPKHVPNAKMVYVITRADLIAKNDEECALLRLELQTRIKKITGQQTADVRIISSHKGWGVDLLADSITKRAGTATKEVFCVGVANVGKSSLLNSLARRRVISVPVKDPVTESHLPGTTLGTVRLPIQPYGMKHQAVINDTPGFAWPGGGLMQYVDPDVLRDIMPKKTIATTEPEWLRPGQSLLLGGLIRIDYPEDEGTDRVRVGIFTNLPWHIARSEKVDKIMEYARRPVVDESEERRREITPIIYDEPLQPLGRPIDLTDLYSPNAYARDLVLAGLGWISFEGTKGKGNKCVLRVNVPEVKDGNGLGVGVRKSLLGGSKEGMLKMFRDGI